jgi:hypothetical protein
LRLQTEAKSPARSAALIALEAGDEQSTFALRATADNLRVACQP